MSRMMEFIKSLYGEAVEWCEGRLWHFRLLIVIWFVYILVNHLADPMYQSLFKPLNLGIHELGHFVFRPLGRFLEVAGGSVLQCLAPIISMVMFFVRRDFFAIAFCFGWLSTNLFDVATYVADARDMALPLVNVGGGDAIHDWHYILSDMGMLNADTTLAFLVRIGATISMVISLLAGVWLLWQMFKYRRA